MSGKGSIVRLEIPDGDQPCEGHDRRILKQAETKTYGNKLLTTFQFPFLFTHVSTYKPFELMSLPSLVPV